MPVYDADKIVGSMRQPYAEASGRARFEHRIRCAALDAVENSSMAIEDVAVVLAIVARDVRDSVKRERS